MPTPVSKGGQKSPPALDQPKPATIESVNAAAKKVGAEIAQQLDGIHPAIAAVAAMPLVDRVDTPAGTNVAEVQAAVRKIEREKALKLARQNRHMSTCPTSRGLECACPANLFHEHKPLESKKFGEAELVRVDEGHQAFRMIPDPQSPRSPAIKQPYFVLPRWVCLKCGWAARATGFNGHACDPSLELWRDAPLPLSSTVSPEKKQKGAYRLTIWRDNEGRYHLGEIVIDGDLVVDQRELSAEVYFPAVEGELSDRLMSEFE